MPYKMVDTIRVQIEYPEQISYVQFLASWYAKILGGTYEFYWGSPYRKTGEIVQNKDELLRHPGILRRLYHRIFPPKFLGIYVETT